MADAMIEEYDPLDEHEHEPDETTIESVAPGGYFRAICLCGIELIGDADNEDRDPRWEVA
jgi:hypothetical protein